MNMKKTIAAIAAGAVAVSAMATTVSAITLDSRTLTYNLVKSTKNDDATVTLTATFPNINLVDGEDIEIQVLGYTWGDEITIRGNYLEEGHQVVQITTTENTWSDKFNAGLVPSWDGKVTIPVLEVNASNRVAFEAGSTGTVTTPHEDAVTEAVGAITYNIDHTNTGSEITTGENLTVAGPVDGDGNGTVASSTTPITITYDKTNDKWTSAGGKVWSITGFKTATEAALDDGDTVTIATYTSPKAEVDEVKTGASELHANITVEVLKKNLSQKNISEVNDALKAVTPTLGIKLKNGAAAAILGATSASNFGGNGLTKHPFRSTLAGSDNVITSVHNTDDDSSLVSSTAIMAVINDAVANYSDVTFTFNTAAKNVKVFWAIDASDGNKRKFVDAIYTDDGTYDLKKEDQNWGSEYGGIWSGDQKYSEIVDCKAFGRHWWNDAPGYDPNTIYITQDWLNNNLFEGALIVNGGLTLSLKDTAKFDWTATSLTFTWDAIQDTALTKNQYANYIQTMVLKTSTDWYWDNFQVTLGETEVEEVESGAPVEGDVEDLPEDEEETDLGDVDEPEEEEEEEESEPAPEVAPAVESNPGTGNAPVALAVIPVALAAAAIVAKKRG